MLLHSCLDFVSAQLFFFNFLTYRAEISSPRRFGADQTTETLRYSSATHKQGQLASHISQTDRKKDAQLIGDKHKRADVFCTL